MKALGVGAGIVGAALLALIALGTVVQVLLLGPARSAVGAELWALRGVVGAFTVAIGGGLGLILHGLGEEVLQSRARRLRAQTEDLRRIEAEIDAELEGRPVPPRAPVDPDPGFELP